jgi:precorrin-4/cobalt-precorrin-4 C11-methyltransferase
LSRKNIPFELILGISAFQAVAARSGTELTIPDLVQTIILTRISGCVSAVPEAEELASLCLYLSARHIETTQEN